MIGWFLVTCPWSNSNVSRPGYNCAVLAWCRIQQHVISAWLNEKWCDPQYMLMSALLTIANKDLNRIMEFGFFPPLPWGKGGCRVRILSHSFARTFRIPSSFHSSFQVTCSIPDWVYFILVLQKSPEEVDQRSADMWSYAMILWELVTREVPFGHLSPMEVGMKVSYWKLFTH